jgi:hypothetical protein
MALNMALPNDLFIKLGVPKLAGYPQPIEPRGADPHAGWCGRGREGITFTPRCRFQRPQSRCWLLAEHDST